MTNIRIGYEHPDRLRTSGYLNNLSGCVVPIQIRGSYPDTWFLSRTRAGGLTPPIDGLLTPPRASSTPAQHTDNLSACTGARSRSAAKDSLAPRFDGLQGRKQASRAHHRARHQAACTQHTALAPRAPFCCAAMSRTMRRMPQTRRTPGPAPARLARPHLVPTTRAYTTRIQNAHTKRARTNRSGRATYSAQALGRLPWFAPFLRRSRRLRPRFDMSFSLGLLSRLKHFCTHWPKPPRHRPFAATKVTEKRAATPTSSAGVTPRGRALSQRA